MAARILVLALAAALACSPAPRPEVDDARLARARAAADALGKDLMSLLTRELERGGPDAAIAVCADSAQVRLALDAARGASPGPGRDGNCPVRSVARFGENSGTAWNASTNQAPSRARRSMLGVSRKG